MSGVNHLDGCACSICNGGMDAYIKASHEKIEKFGRTVLGVWDEDHPGQMGFFYTVGNSLKGLPELLLVLNVSPDFGASFLNFLSNKMIEQNKAFDHMELVDTGGKFPVMTVMANDHAKEHYMIQVENLLGPKEFEVLQIVIPDRSGLFPNDPNCDDHFKGQPIFSDIKANTLN